jgi:hypothetical protein
MEPLEPVAADLSLLSKRSKAEREDDNEYVSEGLADSHENSLGETNVSPLEDEEEEEEREHENLCTQLDYESESGKEIQTQRPNSDSDY